MMRLVGSRPRRKAGRATEKTMDLRWRGGTVVISRLIVPSITRPAAYVMASMCQFGRYTSPGDTVSNTFVTKAEKCRAIPGLNEDPRSRWLTPGARWIRVWLMIRPGFLSAAERGALIAVARDGLVEHRVARRANAIVLLNDGWNCEEVGSALLLDDDTVREWFEVYQRQGMAGLRNFGHEGSSCQLTDE